MFTGNPSSNSKGHLTNHTVETGRDLFSLMHQHTTGIPTYLARASAMHLLQLAGTLNTELLVSSTNRAAQLQICSSPWPSLDGSRV